MMLLATPYTIINAHNVEVIFFGMNCVLYIFCVYTLWGQRSISCRLLLLINTVQYILCVTQAILHTIFCFIVFTVLTGDIQPYMHRMHVYILGSAVIFVINFVAGGFLSIWRLYVLYENEIRVCIPAFIIWIAQICASAITIRIRATLPIGSASFSPVTMLLWAFITALNLCVAIPICIRLYIAQKRTHAILSSSPFKSIAIVLVECGALVTACSVAMMVLYACNFVYALVSTGIATQIAVTSQLLITARHGMLSQGRKDLSPSSTALDINVARAQFRHVNPPTKPIKSKALCSFAEPKSKGWQPIDANTKTNCDVVL